MLLGSALPSPLPSTACARHDDGMNCIGPTARSQIGARRPRPPVAVRGWSPAPGPPACTGPRIGERCVRSRPARRRGRDPTRPCRCRPAPAHGRWQPGSLGSNRRSPPPCRPFSTLAGMPEALPVTQPRRPVLPCLAGSPAVDGLDRRAAAPGRDRVSGARVSSWRYRLVPGSQGRPGHHRRSVRRLSLHTRRTARR